MAASAMPIGSAQDHKRALDGDRGPNTGGMGAFAPSPLLTPELEAQVLEAVVHPVLSGMRDEGHPVSRLPLLRPDADGATARW